MIELREHANGLLLPVRAQPGARKAGLVGAHGGALKVAVTAPAQDGRANDALVEILRKELGLKRSQLELVGGDKSRDKLFLIRGMQAADLHRRLQELLA